MSSRFHNKWHRHNHHTYPSSNPSLPDSSHDPIASKESPFLGDFVLQGALSANAQLSAYAGSFTGDRSAILLGAPTFCLSGIGSSFLSGDTTIDGSLFVTQNIRSNDTVSMYRGEVDTDFTIFGSLSVLGQVNTVNVTTFEGVCALSLNNFGAGPVLSVNQIGNEPILSVSDDSTPVLYIPNGGNLGIKTTSPNKELTVVGEISATSNIFANGATIGGAAIIGGATTIGGTLSSNNAILNTPVINNLTIGSTSIGNILSSNNSVLNSPLINNNLTISGNISGNNLRTSFNLGSATGDYSFAVGNGRAFGLFSHAEGQNTIASGDYSHSEGFGTTAGDYSHAEGFGTTASGFASHTEGGVTRASGAQSHAEGQNTIASGPASHAEGQRTDAKGNTSHAAGFRATAAQDYTYAWSDGRLGTTTTNISTTKAGQYMIDASGGVYIPGNIGLGTSDPGAKLDIVGSVAETQALVNIVGTGVTLNLATASYFVVSVTSLINTFFIQNIPASPRVVSFTLQTQGGGGAQPVWTFNNGVVNTSVRWPGGVAPVVTTAVANPAKIDIYNFITYDGGVTWLGFVGGQNM